MKSFINVEIKAKCFHPEKVEAFLISAGARFQGVDHQTDIYFNCPNGRLKLRTGNIENNLIFYNRPDEPGPKQSHFQLMPVADAAALQQLLTDALSIKVKVVKTRRIYFLGNIKVHLDELEGLGNFVEIEAGNLTDTAKTVEELHTQCNDLMHNFGIEEHDLIDKSYSDMLLVEIEGL
jgi:predicted adenylyl cyclase CyaB